MNAISTEGDPQAELYRSFALAHLSMISQAAIGTYKPDPGEIDERQAWLVGYITEGKGILTEENLRIAQTVTNALAILQNAENTTEAA